MVGEDLSRKVGQMESDSRKDSLFEKTFWGVYTDDEGEVECLDLHMCLVMLLRRSLACYLDA